MQGKSHGNISVNGKLIGRLTKRKQELHETIPMHGEWGQGGRESLGCNAGHGRPWETACDASVNTWRVTERNTIDKLNMVISNLILAKLLLRYHPLLVLSFMSTQKKMPWPP